MPEAQYEDRSGRDLVAHLVVADDDPADLARLIGFQLLADPRIIDQPIRCVGELLDNARRRFGGDRTQMLVQSHKVRRRLAGPLDLHLTGEGSGLSVPRLSAQDRKSVGEGKSVSVRVDLGGRRILKTQKKKKTINK